MRFYYIYFLCILKFHHHQTFNPDRLIIMGFSPLCLSANLARTKTILKLNSYVTIENHFLSIINQNAQKVASTSLAQLRLANDIEIRLSIKIAYRGKYFTCV